MMDGRGIGYIDRDTYVGLISYSIGLKSYYRIKILDP